MDYAVLGDSVILAQRLESAAPKGETYVSDLTHRLTADRFEFEPVGELTLKGKSEPVPAWRLLARATRGARDACNLASSGRERELEAIAGAIESSERSASRCGHRRAGRREVPAHRRRPRRQAEASGSRLAPDPMPLLRRRARLLAVRGAPADDRGHRARRPEPDAATEALGRSVGDALGARTSRGCSDSRSATRASLRSSPKRSGAGSTTRSRRGSGPRRRPPRRPRAGGRALGGRVEPRADRRAAARARTRRSSST